MEEKSPSVDSSSLSKATRVQWCALSGEAWALLITQVPFLGKLLVKTAEKYLYMYLFFNNRLLL